MMYVKLSSLPLKLFNLYGYKQTLAQILKFSILIPRIPYVFSMGFRSGEPPDQVFSTMHSHLMLKGNNKIVLPFQTHLMSLNKYALNCRLSRFFIYYFI